MIVADPAVSALTSNAMNFVPARMTTESGTVATSGFDELSVTVVSEASVALEIALSEPVDPGATLCVNGASVSDGCGTVIEPSTSASLPFACVSFVADVPPSSVSCVSDGSSVSAIDDPGAADADSVTTRCATTLPGAGALSVNGSGVVDS